MVRAAVVYFGQDQLGSLGELIVLRIKSIDQGGYGILDIEHVVHVRKVLALMLLNSVEIKSYPGSRIIAC